MTSTHLHATISCGRFPGHSHDRNGLVQFQMIKQAKQRPSPMTLYHRHMWGWSLTFSHKAQPRSSRYSWRGVISGSPLTRNMESGVRHTSGKCSDSLMLPNLGAAPFTLYFWSIYTSKHTMACTQGSLTKSSFSTTTAAHMSRPVQTYRHGRYDVSTGVQSWRSTTLS